jgi:hypothetical protein
LISYLDFETEEKEVISSVCVTLIKDSRWMDRVLVDDFKNLEVIGDTAVFKIFSGTTF